MTLRAGRCMEGYLCTELFRKSPFQCLAAAMLFGWLRFVMPYRRISASRLQLRLAGGKSLLGVNSVRSATDRDGRCKYPSTMVFAKMALEAAAGRFSLNPLSASRFTDVDPRTCYNCKLLIARHFRKHRVPGKFLFLAIIPRTVRNERP